MKLTNDQVYENLKKIDASKDEGVSENQFIDEKGRTSGESQSLILYLLDHDLIELEDDANYFLTDRGYNVLENRLWYDPILVEQDSERKSRELNYSSTSNEKENVNKKPYLSHPISYFIEGSLIFFLVSLLYQLYIKR